LFAEHRAFEHTEQRLTECLGHSADTPKALVTDDLVPLADYQGCYLNYNGTSSAQLLAGPFFTAANLTHQSCYNFCSSGNSVANGGAPGGPYDLAGVTNSTQCRCGFDYAYIPQASRKCVLSAGGNDTQQAGASNAINVWRRRADVRPLSYCSLLKCSALCKLVLHTKVSMGKYDCASAQPLSMMRTNIMGAHHTTHISGRLPHTTTTYFHNRIRRQCLDMRWTRTVSTSPFTSRHLPLPGQLTHSRATELAMKGWIWI
jgi:hypothetical protein